jgi:hypothetical protein
LKSGPFFNPRGALIWREVKTLRCKTGSKPVKTLRFISRKEVSNRSSKKSWHGSLLQTKQPRNFNTKRLSDSHQLKVQYATDSGFNFGNSSTVNRDAQLGKTFGKFLLRDWRLRFASRVLHAFPNKILADLSHRAARLPGSPQK